MKVYDGLSFPFFSSSTSSNVMRESVSEGFSADVNLSVDDSLSDAGDDILGRSQAYGMYIRHL